MSGNIELTGVDHPLRADVLQGTGATPGTIVVDCGAPSEMPLSFTLSLYGYLKTLRWTECRLVSLPRWCGSFVRMTLEDSRWKLRETVMRQSFNQYADGGAVHNPRTLAELWSDIAAAAELTITTSNLPDIQPPAEWIGRKASECAHELLDITACRMVYDPEAQAYVVSPAGTGAYPDRTERFRRPVENKKPDKVVAVTAPILYESELEISAVLPNHSGEFVSFATAGVDAVDFFSGFEGEAKPERAMYRNSAFRVWKLESASHPRALTAGEVVMMPFRSIPGLMSEIIGDSMTYLPRAFSPVAGEGIADTPVRIALGSIYVHADEPVIRVSGGSVQTTAGLVTCYYALSDGVPDRGEKEAAVGGDQPTVTIECDWLKPIISDRDDAPTDLNDWEDKAQAIATAHATKWSATAEQASIHGLHGTAGSGQVGAVRYRAALIPRRAFETTFALNHEPKYQL